MEVGKVYFQIPYLFKRTSAERSSYFFDEFMRFIEWVNEMQKRSERLKERVLNGEDVPLHELVVEAKKAEVALNLLIEVRNKLLDAYNELMKMQV
ncbi:MAG: flagellar hook-basal body complex protein FliE [Aquificae bacterium]|nr:flagellar hook-basal body complex protein FliE [Aquificota bacterium]